MPRSQNLPRSVITRQLRESQELIIGDRSSREADVNPSSRTVIFAEHLEHGIYDPEGVANVDVTRLSLSADARDKRPIGGDDAARGDAILSS